MKPSKKAKRWDAEDETHCVESGAQKGHPRVWTTRRILAAQLNSYLRFSNLEVGLLLNFRIWPLQDGGIKRVINAHA